MSSKKQKTTSNMNTKQKQYHYEYDVVNVSLCHGGIKLGRFRTFDQARIERAMKSCWGNMGSLWDIRKVRVYNK